MKCKLIIKKVIILLLIFSCTFIQISYADEREEEDNENIINEIRIEESNVINSSNNENKIPVINSRKYVIYDRKSGLRIYGKNEYKQSAMASTTKIMTAIVVLENCKNIDEEVIIEQKAAGTGGSRLGLKNGDKITVNDLLFGLLMKSGNDAAIALAIHTAETVEKFADLMNKKAQELGLEHTHFVTPHGLDDPNHYTTAYELAKLTDYALKNDIIATMVKTKYATISINGIKKELKNTNELLCGNYEGVYGVKTGFTNNAGRCLVTAVKRGNIDLIVVVLEADTRKARASDTMKLIEYAYKTYRLENVEQKIEEEFENWKSINKDRIYIYKANSQLNLKMDEIKIKELVTEKDINIEINSINYLEAPINKNTKIGTIIVKNGEDIIEEIDILVANTINRLGISDYLRMFAKVYCL